MPLDLKKYIAAAIFWMACLTANGQENQYSIQHYSTNDGLSENFVTDLALDKKGFLWIATEGGGISRFDGQNFRAYNMLNTPALLTNLFYGIYKLPNGNMEILGFAKHWYKISDNYIITPDSILSADPWVALGIDNFFLYGSLTKNSNWPKAIGQPNVPSSIKQGGNLIVNDKECYAFLNYKVYYLNVGSQTVKELKALEIQDGMFFDKNHFFLSGLFVSNDRNGVLAYRKGIPQTNVRFSKDAKGLMAKVSNRTGHYFCSANGSFLVSNNSLYRLESNRDSIWTTFLLHNEALDDNNIGAIKVDVISGNIYFSTNEGFYALRPISIHDMDMEKDPRYMTSVVTDVIPLDNGDMLSNTQYFNIYTKKTRLLQNPLLYTTLFKCNDGSLLYIRDDTLIWSDQAMRHIYLRKATKSFPNFMEDRQHGFVWALFDNAVWKLHKDGRIEKIIDKGDHLQFVQLTDNTILLGMMNGWSIYDIAKNQIITDYISPFVNVNNTYQTKDSAIWMASMGMGFYRYKDGKYLHMPMDNGKKLEIVKCFYEDTNGFLWIGTSNGLVQCLISDLNNYALDSTKLPYYYVYNKYDGLLKSDFMTGVLSPRAMDSRGMLVFGTSTGVTYFPPLAMRPLTISGAILIEALSVDDSTIVISDHIDLRPNFNRLRVSAVLPYLGNRENITIEYNISGLNNTWYRVDENSAISIDRLPAGRYKLVVRSQKGMGTNDYQYASFNFTVLPYFYQTWWFYTLILLLVILGTAFFFLSKTRALVRGKLLLEKQVETRTEKLNDSLNNLNIVMEDLYKSEQKFYHANEIKEQAMAIIFHDLKAPVRYLNMAATGFRANVESLSRPEINQFSKTFEQSTQEINKFVEGLLQWLVLQQEDFRATYAQILILPVFREIASLYKEISALNGNVIVVGTDLENLSVNTDRDIFKIIIRNLVDNAVKNTTGGQILLSAAQVDGISTITVADNGRGMDKATLEKLLSERVDTDNTLKTTSLGFGFVKRFLKLINGSIQIESEFGIGTSVFVSLTNI